MGSSFQRVLIAQIFRPDLMLQQLRRVSSELLGISPDASTQPSVEQLLQQSSCDRPILMISQAENDPTTELRKWSNQKYREMAIGRGSEKRVLAEMRQAALDGHWLCVKNVHLVPEFLAQVERELSEMHKAKEFRLWLLCESTEGFSESAVFKCLKVRYEQPKGLKQIVMRLLQNYAAEQDQQGKSQPKSLKMRLVFFIMTAVLQQRRQFIPQGWSKYYEFGEADLKAALGILKWMDQQLHSGKCDWLLLQRLSEALAFGGRVNNARDLDILRSYLSQFCSADVLSNRWSPLGLSLSIPTSNQLQDYYGALEKLPDQDEPSMYGLASQAQQQREIEQAKRVIKELRGLHYGRGMEGDSGDPAGAGEANHLTDRQKLEQQIKPLLNLWRKLAGSCTIAQTVKEAAKDSGESPWALFVLAELKVGADLYRTVHQTLSQMHAWLKDSQEVDGATLRALAEQQVRLFKGRTL